MWKVHNRTILVLPDIREKGKMLLDLMTKVLPSATPAVFPYSSRFAWKGEPEYFLPNHSQLLAAKDALRQEFTKRIDEADKEISENIQKHDYLHRILSETGEPLVHAVFQFMKWLGFERIRMSDETAQTFKEEDLQVDLENGLLIIEVKGLGGTSTDSECAQISKIKYRRSRERNAFDVIALYLVNHQRHLPPLLRTNPPFSQHQAQDAINDGRGLCTTWDLFNLYFNVTNG